MGKNIALVLSSGGARGLAHIGVIEELEKQGFKITSIAGSSMGAMVGGMYAAGAMKEYKKWVCNLDKMDVFKLIDFTFSLQGFIRGERVFNEVGRFLQQKNIEDLPISFAAVATDIQNRTEEVFTSGSLFQAIRASVAVPTVLPPIYVNGRELVDGGVLNPVPVEYVSRSEGDLLAIVNVNATIPFANPVMESILADANDADYRSKIALFKAKWLSLLPNGTSTPKKLGFFDLMNKSYDLMQDRLSSLIIQNHNPDILVNISRNVCNTFEFYRGEAMIEEGKRACREGLKNSGICM